MAGVAALVQANYMSHRCQTNKPTDIQAAL